MNPSPFTRCATIAHPISDKAPRPNAAHHSQNALFCCCTGGRQKALTVKYTALTAAIFVRKKRSRRLGEAAYALRSADDWRAISGQFCP